MLTMRQGAAFLAGLCLLGLTGRASAGDGGLDRSLLSYEDNVTINTSCFGAHKMGDSAYDQCVHQQVAALSSHPAPDLAHVPESRSQLAARNCAYLRRVGLAPYNDCLAKAILHSPERD